VRRTALALPIALASVVALAACAAPAPTEPTEPGETPVSSNGICDTPGGDAVAAVSVSGDFGAEPDVAFEGDLTVTTTQRAVVIEGTGDATEEGDVMNVAFTVINATTGTTIDAYGYDEDQNAQFTADTAVQLEGIARSVACLPVGTRVASVVPPAEGFGPNGSPDLGIGADDMLIFVIDIESVVPTRAWGVDQPAPEGLPPVTLDASGVPSIRIPAGDAPADLRIGVLKLGDGPVVGDADTVTIQYHGVKWSDGSVFDQSWPSPTSFSVQGVVKGFSAALIGQTVGSQVIVSMPPSLGYGEAGTSTHPLAGETLVFVIDILETTAG